MTDMITQRMAKVWIAALLTAIGLAGGYVAIRLILFIMADYGWIEKLVAGLLFLAETFIIIHGINYFRHIIQVLRVHGTLFNEPPVPQLGHDKPPVAIVVSSFREPLAVIENTLVCFHNLTYANKSIYLLDDTRYDQGSPEDNRQYRVSVDALCRRIGIPIFRRKWHGAKAGMINDFLAFRAGETRKGFEIQSWGKSPGEPEKYMMVFDADMNPFPDTVEPLAAQMEADPKLAFIQTPQYYTNFEANRIARAAGLQQVVFYEYICEGKGIEGAMFCCGTNVIFRRAALMDIGGFDETSVTEDIVTSVKFHMNGWRSAYSSKVCAFGMGPEDLGGYFKQQFRWALGTLGLFRHLVSLLISRPRAMALSAWWEYIVSSTYYFIGTVFLLMVLAPICYLFFRIPTYFARPEIYFIAFIPYFALTLLVFFTTLARRQYHFRDIVLGQLLIAVTFPVYLQAAWWALLGKRGGFVVTPKTGANSLPLKSLWPQLLILILCYMAVVWGFCRIYYEREVVSAVLVNMFWCLYHMLILGSVFYFNAVEPSNKQKI
ncbi:MAG: glycosyltransferase [Verrucomicrobia bacterium]|nr:glycosyltransferase [Verrucomicrobiota bacterium]MBU1735212.1 glycosyltransferase [Verrucomicrobiota bacterium]